MLVLWGESAGGIDVSLLLLCDIPFKVLVFEGGGVREGIIGSLH